MRVNPSVQGNQPSSSAAAGAPATKGKEASGVDAKKQAVRVSVADQLKLSPEAMLKYGQSRLESHVRDKLKEQFAAAGVDLDAAQGQDWSPDATAHRIFDFASGLLGAYRKQHPELSETDAVNKFETLIRGAVDKGYGQAMDVLNGMGASDEVVGTAKTTIDNVHTLFDDFFAGLRAQPTPSAEGTTAAAKG
jgi:hypothetical protein